jgi:hypothetical protein
MQLEQLDRLDHAILTKLEVVLRKIEDREAVAPDDGDIDAHSPDTDAKGRRLGRRLAGWRL